MGRYFRNMRELQRICDSLESARRTGVRHSYMVGTPPPPIKPDTVPFEQRLADWCAAHNIPVPNYSSRLELPPQNGPLVYTLRNRQYTPSEPAPVAKAS